MTTPDSSTEQVKSDSDPAKVAENDIRKLHAEVNQIVSQRFSLTTAAVVAFATICGWATATEKDKPVDPNFLALMEMLVLSILAALYAYFMILLGMMRILTVYLVEKYNSPWEIDWRRFRNLPHYGKYRGNSMSGTLIFQLLGILSITYLGALWLVRGGWDRPVPMIFMLPLAAFVLYETLIVAVTNRREKPSKEASSTRDWKKVLHTSSIDTPQHPDPQRLSRR